MKSSITRKIILSYFFIIAASIAVIAILFHFVSKDYVEEQVRENLKKDAKNISQLFQKDIIGDNDTIDMRVRQLFRESQKIRRIIGELDSNYMILSVDFKFIYPRPGEDASKLRSQLLAQQGEFFSEDGVRDAKVRVDNLDYLAIILPIKGENSDTVKGWTVLYAPVVEFSNFAKGISILLIISMVLTGVLAVIIGIFIARSIAKPVIMLKKSAERLSKRDFDTYVNIKSGDELEELANTVNKMAAELKEYDISQKAFLQNASHELKTPLMSIQGYAEGIKDGVFEDNRKALDIIIEESNRMKSIVEELVFLSKLETMEDFYKYDYEGINGIIDKSIEKVKGIAIKNNINIKSELQEDVFLKIDRNKMMQALINILGNCLRYARSEISVTTSKDAKSFKIFINDDGEGFDSNEAGNVFKRLYKGKKGNTGLGMAITKAIIEKHGGGIEAGNGSSDGAEFRISLPLK